ncbi:MAG: PAS domain S-box protein [Rhizobiaceae bacterium]|nr:MAG: PAS domain S-box protein [Rhizobiaceae bacterium]
MKSLDLRQQQRALLDNIPDMAWLKDRECHYLAVNTAYLRVLGVAEEEVLGRTPREVWSPEIAEVYLRSDQAVLRSGRRRRYEETRPSPDGGLRCFETIKSPIRDENGRIVGTVGISRDISERKAAEDELVASRAELRALSHYLQKVREEERKRIARELHDELGQTLTAMKMDLGWLREHLPGQQYGARTERLIGLVDRSVADLRRIASDLRPLILDELGLVSAMHWLVDKVAAHSDLDIDLTFDREDLTYDAETSTAAFRIVQEALTNVVRHSGARTVTISAYHAQERLHIEILDDGRGLPPVATSRRFDRHGLLGMDERARMLGGTVSVGNVPDGGVRVCAILPLASRGAVS